MKKSWFSCGKPLKFKHDSNEIFCLGDRLGLSDLLSGLLDDDDEDDDNGFSCILWFINGVTNPGSGGI